MGGHPRAREPVHVEDVAAGEEEAGAPRPHRIDDAVAREVDDAQPGRGSLDGREHGLDARRLPEEQRALRLGHELDDGSGLVRALGQGAAAAAVPAPRRRRVADGEHEPSPRRVLGPELKASYHEQAAAAAMSAGGAEHVAASGQGGE